jgi:hypothetical protein
MLGIPPQTHPQETNIANIEDVEKKARATRKRKQKNIAATKQR